MVFPSQRLKGANNKIAKLQQEIADRDKKLLELATRHLQLAVQLDVTMAEPAFDVESVPYVTLKDEREWLETNKIWAPTMPQEKP